MDLFRRSETPQDGPSQHAMTLDLIEQVAALRGQVRAMESEWDDIRAQIRKGYQRMEKAYERLEDAGLEEPAQEVVTPLHAADNLHGFAKKMAQRDALRGKGA